MNVPAKPSLIAMLASKYVDGPGRLLQDHQVHHRAQQCHRRADGGTTDGCTTSTTSTRILKQVYAFPIEGRRHHPDRSPVDGWCELMQPAANLRRHGVHRRLRPGPQGTGDAITCSMYRKDRSRPTVVDEYLDECQRSTDPWKNSAEGACAPPRHDRVRPPSPSGACRRPSTTTCTRSKTCR